MAVETERWLSSYELYHTSMKTRVQIPVPHNKLDKTGLSGALNPSTMWEVEAGGLLGLAGHQQFI